MFGTIPCVIFLFCSSRYEWSHSQAQQFRAQCVDVSLHAGKKGGQSQQATPTKKKKKKVSGGETAKAFAIVADKLKESEKPIQYNQKLNKITQHLAVISKSLDRLKKDNAAELKEIKLQFAMDYTEQIARYFSRHHSTFVYSGPNKDFVEDTLMLFRQNRAHWLPEHLDDTGREAYADAIEFYLGHCPTVGYDDEEEKYFISYEQLFMYIIVVSEY